METTSPLPDERERPHIEDLLERQAAPAIALSTDYRILATNQAYRDNYADGMPLVNRRCFEVSHRFDAPCDQAGESCPLSASLATGHKQRVLHLHHTSQGEEHVDVQTHPMRNEQGDIEYLIEVMRTTRAASSRPDASAMVGRSPPFNRQLELIHRVAPSEASVLLQGESGTGKELVARAIHADSPRSDKPFVAVECSGLTETLFESELYGHERGAFTGALHRKTGLVQAAEEGTLFLDEIGDVPMSLQVKLLRLLETGTYRRVGGVDPRQADFRLVTATHRDLRAMVEDGQFRRDLYYRISAFPIPLPALRDRREDLPLLAASLLTRLAPDHHYELSSEALSCLRRHSFPGNIRELRNLLERATLLADGDRLLPEHLPVEICKEHPVEKSVFLDNGEEILTLDEVERRYLQRIAARFPGDRDSLAKVLGISRRTLFRKLQQLQS